MTTNVFDKEIIQYLPKLGDEEKMSLLQTIKTFLSISNKIKVKNKSDSKFSAIDYSKYNYPISEMKFDRGEINER